MSGQRRIRVELVEDPANPEVVAIFQKIHARQINVSAEPGGPPLKVGNIHRLVANSPQLFAAFVGLADALRSHTEIDPAERELALLCALDIHGDDYEIMPHRILAKQYGVTDEMLDKVSDPESPVFSERQRAVLRFAKLLATDRDQRSTCKDPRIEDYLDNRQRIELALNVSCYIGFSRLTDVLDVPREAAFKNLANK